METKINATTARNIELEKVLNRLGCKPKKSSEKELWYTSPFRDEKTPSFKLDTTINKWFDFGENKGGNTLDFVIHKFGYSVKEALEFLADYSSFSFQPPKEIILKSEDRIKILSEGEIKHPALIEYLGERKICLEVAKAFCKEIYYSINSKEYFALGLKNCSKGYSLRNKYFKGSTKQDVTCIVVRNDILHPPLYFPSNVWIFEGMFDLLSQAQIIYNYGGFYPYIYDDFIVLNSVSNYIKAIEIISKHYKAGTDVFACVDNDKAGDSIINKLKIDLKDMLVHDNRERHKDYKDLNDYLMNESE